MMAPKVLENYIRECAVDYLENETELEGIQKEDAISTLTIHVLEAYTTALGVTYKRGDDIYGTIDTYYKKNIKDQAIIFDNSFIVGQLINMLENDKDTKK